MTIKRFEGPNPDNVDVGDYAVIGTPATGNSRVGIFEITGVDGSGVEIYTSHTPQKLPYRNLVVLKDNGRFLMDPGCTVFERNGD